MTDEHTVIPPVVLTDLPPLADAAIPTAADVTAGPLLTPEQYIYFYDGGEWERFILEWAHALTGDYVSVKLLGGPGDQGIDIAAMATERGLEDAWDCYQCKHYANALTPSDAWPELLKLFFGVLDGAYAMPRKYRFVAPRGCGPKLKRFLSTPTTLRQEFLKQLEVGGALYTSGDADRISAVRTLAASTDFSLFNSEELSIVVALHRTTPHFTRRFGGGLPARPSVPVPPEALAPYETRYVEQLIEVYSEKFPGPAFTADLARSRDETADHFARQREAFYSAEALRVFARDSVPPGTFEALQDELHAGVVEQCDTSHPSGWERLTAVLTTSATVDLTANALITVAKVRDRKGMCHQLANDDRLTWVR